MTVRPWIATYRVQFGPDFSFADATALVPYFAALGISHLYASPIALARAGSNHGYDVCDPTRVSPALGGETGFRALVDALHRHDIGVLLDIVPNHMATDEANPYWMDALEFGATGPAGKIFDIDWSRPVSLAWLSEGDENPGALSADWEGGRLMMGVGGGRAPLRPRSVATLLQPVDPALSAQWNGLEGAGIGRDGIDRARQGLRALNPSARAAVEASLAAADRDAIAADQHWSGIPWRDASTELSYRRFFAVAELIGVRVEEDCVFDLLHELPLRLLREGLVDGLRIDHIDGLADPEAYCRKLRAAAGPHAPIFLEKILGADETLRAWPVDGTTGYEHLNAISQLFIDPEGRSALRQRLFAATGLVGDALARSEAAKEELLRSSFRGEVDRLVSLSAPRFAGVAREARRDAIVALIRAFPVYRSYASPRGFDGDDQALWQEAKRRAEAGAADAALVGDIVAWLSAGDPDAAEFLRRFQQLTGPAMAKGVEDTELYRDVSLGSANEVGVDLGSLFRTPDEFAALFAPGDRRGLVPLATHDTKRGADTRARLNALSTMADRFTAFFDIWSERLEPLRDSLGGPAAADEWLTLQAMVGAGPLSHQRLSAYLVKAVREARLRSDWEDPDTAYEDALTAYARALDLAGNTPFRAAFHGLMAPLVVAGRRNGLAQAILQLALPGTPDIYQGTELWEHSLVDPDNRRPVDFDLRRRLLAEETALPALEDDEFGRWKLQAIRALLGAKRRHPELFAAEPEFLSYGPAWMILRRQGGGQELLVAVPLRNVASTLIEIDIGAAADGAWQNLLRDGTVAVQAGRAPMDADFPFLVLLRPTAA